MKSFLSLLSLVILLSINIQTFAQNKNSTYHPIYDYIDSDLKSTDTISDFNVKKNKVKLFGTIYNSDGVTPAKDVILYIEQADEDGDFDLRTQNDRRIVHHRAWVKTDANGQYELYTFIPGNDRRYNQLQQLFPVIKEPSKPEYEIGTFLFNDDPLLTKHCRKRLKKKGDPTRILTLNDKDGLLLAQKDIVLK